MISDNIILPLLKKGLSYEPRVIETPTGVDTFEECSEWILSCLSSHSGRFETVEALGDPDEVYSYLARVSEVSLDLWYVDEANDAESWLMSFIPQAGCLHAYRPETLKQGDHWRSFCARFGDGAGIVVLSDDCETKPLFWVTPGEA